MKKDTGEWQSLVFLQFNDHEMVSWARDDDTEEVSLCRLFLTAIGGERFLNVQEIGGDGAPWYFARCVLDGDRVHPDVRRRWPVRLPRVRFRGGAPGS